LFLSARAIDGGKIAHPWTLRRSYLFIGERGMIVSCLHIFSPEDENCWHSLTRNERQLATGSTQFYTGKDKRCEPYIMDETAFESFAQYVYEYTLRKLTYQSDALAAFLGVPTTLEGMPDCKFLHGIPEGEFDAGILWSPLGTHTRRPEFPSWSWIGWIGGVAYPWSHERDTYFTTEKFSAGMA
jgi:hypothetical protein